MNEFEYLPIGTVVKLKDADKLLFIAGYRIHSNDNPKKIYDYIGYLYPEGFLSKDKNILFNKEIIEKVFYYGYKNEDYEKFKGILMGGEVKNEQ